MASQAENISHNTCAEPLQPAQLGAGCYAVVERRIDLLDPIVTIRSPEKFEPTLRDARTQTWTFPPPSKAAGSHCLIITCIPDTSLLRPVDLNLPRSLLRCAASRRGRQFFWLNLSILVDRAASCRCCDTVDDKDGYLQPPFAILTFNVSSVLRARETTTGNC